MKSCGTPVSHASVFAPVICCATSEPTVVLLDADHRTITKDAAELIRIAHGFASIDTMKEQEVKSFKELMTARDKEKTKLAAASKGLEPLETTFAEAAAVVNALEPRDVHEIRTFTRDAPLPFPLAAKLEGATKELRNAQTSVRELDDAALAPLQQDSADGGAPPPATQRVFEAACLVLGVKVSADWATTRQTLLPQLRERVAKLDPKSVAPAAFKQLARLDLSEGENGGDVSSPVVGVLAAWARALVVFDDASDAVKLHHERLAPSAELESVCECVAILHGLGADSVHSFPAALALADRKSVV